MIAFSLLAAAFALRVSAQDIPAETSESQLQNVEAQYNNSGFDEALPNSQSFGIELDAEALMTVVYGDMAIELGKDLSADAVANMPQIYVTPTSDSADDFSSDNAFTLILADASAVGGPDPEGDYRHYLANGVHFGAATGDNNLTMAVDLSQATVVTYYAGPGPLEGSGTHRYSFLLFKQGADFSAPSNLSTAGVSPSHWSVQEYVQSSNLGDLVAASFFTVTASGTASFSAGSTSAAPSGSASGSMMMSQGASTTGSMSTGAAKQNSDNEDSSASFMTGSISAAALAALAAGLLA